MVKVWTRKIKRYYSFKLGSTKGTTFKIHFGGLVFSCLFDTGAQVCCIKYDMVAALGLLSKISDNNISIRTANGQDMGIKCFSHGQFQTWTI